MSKESDVSARATEDRPIYHKVKHDNGAATETFMIVCDEGWRESIVCEGLYGWAAEWLLEVLDHQPFAPGRRP